MNSIVGDILNLAGITGAGGATNSLVRNPSTPGTRAKAMADFTQDDSVSNPDVWSFYNSSMKQPATFDEMLKLWEDMSTWDLLAAALSEVVEEAVNPDSTSPGTIWYECNDSKIEDELNRMLTVINAEALLPSQVWHVAAMGNHFEKIQYTQGEGVMGLSFAHPMDVRRYWLAKNRKCVGFKWAGNVPDKAGLYKVGAQDLERNAISVNGTTEDLWYPWDFLHFRRMYRLRISEHGEPLFNEASGIYKKLRMALDQMVVHRAQVQPDRYVVNVDVQEQPPAEQMRTVQRWKQSLRSRLAFGQGDSPDKMSQPQDFKSYYNAMSLDTVFYMAKPKGFAHSIEKLAGTATVPDVYDIEMLINLFFSIIGMPRSWIGAGGSAGAEGAPASGKALLAQDIRFYRKVKSVRRPVIEGYTWLGYFHLTLKNQDLTNVDIRTKMTDIGSLEDQMRLEVLDKQLDILTKLGEVIEKFKLPREAWLELIFKKYMHLPDDMIYAFMTALPEEAKQVEESSKNGKTPPRSAVILREIQETLQKQGLDYHLSALQEITSAIGGSRARPPKSKRIWESSDQKPGTAQTKINQGDIIVSSYDNLIRLREDIQKAQSGPEQWRRWGPR